MRALRGEPRRRGPLAAPRGRGIDGPHGSSQRHFPPSRGPLLARNSRRNPVLRGAPARRLPPGRAWPQIPPSAQTLPLAPLPQGLGRGDRSSGRAREGAGGLSQRKGEEGGGSCGSIFRYPRQAPIRGPSAVDSLGSPAQTTRRTLTRQTLLDTACEKLTAFLVRVTANPRRWKERGPSPAPFLLPHP